MCGLAIFTIRTRAPSRRADGAAQRAEICTSRGFSPHDFTRRPGPKRGKTHEVRAQAIGHQLRRGRIPRAAAAHSAALPNKPATARAALARQIHSPHSPHSMHKS
eukprot:scaffold48392_cov31-Tisochrysis_lutea.AAC.5